MSFTGFVHIGIVDPTIMECYSNMDIVIVDPTIQSSTLLFFR